MFCQLKKIKGRQGWRVEVQERRLQTFPAPAHMCVGRYGHMGSRTLLMELHPGGPG